MRASTSGMVVLVTVLGAIVAPSTAAATDTEHYVVILHDSVPDAAAEAAKQAREHGAEEQRVWDTVEGYAADLTAAEAAAVAADPTVQLVIPDREYASVPAEPTAVPCQQVADARQCLPEQLDRIDGEQSSTRAGDGQGSVGTGIAIIDTGVDAGHPELDVTGGADCSSGQAQSPTPETFDHGTIVAGVAAARDNGIGVVGAAPGAPLWSLDVADANGAISLSAVVCAIDWVAQTRADDDPSNDVQVANISLGEDSVPSDDENCGRTVADATHTAICRSVALGTLYTVAAGNSSADLAGTAPAAYDEVLTVTAMDDYDGVPGGLEDPPMCFDRNFDEVLGPLGGTADDAAASYSNFAVSAADRRHTIAAPGTCITSTSPGNRYAVGLIGTSFAAPAVAGIAALCIDTGTCSADDPMDTMARLRGDAAAHTTAEPGYGFLGDLLRSEANRYYGPLVYAGAY